MINFRVLKATKNNIPKLAEIYCKSWHHAYSGIISDTYLEKITVESRIKRFEEMEEIQEYIYIVKDEILGCSRLIESRDKSPNLCAEIQTIYFLPEHTGVGHGINFLTWLINEARRQKYKNLIVWCLTDNVYANRAYIKSGFIKDNERIINIGGMDYNESRYIHKL